MKRTKLYYKKKCVCCGKDIFLQYSQIISLDYLKDGILKLNIDNWLCKECVENVENLWEKIDNSEYVDK